MSRIGRMPITVPAGVTVNIAEGNVVTVKGPKGELTQSLRPEMIIKQEGTTITVERPSDDKLHRSVHGLTRTLLHNMVIGVTEGIYNDTVAISKESQYYTPEIVAALQDCFINIIGTDEGKAIFDVYSHTGYAKATDADYDGARAALQAVAE